MDLHVHDIVASCSQSLYALRMLKANGLPTDRLFQVFQATTLSKLLYASPAWTGFLNANMSNMIEAFLLKSKRFGYCPENLPSFHSLCQETDQNLFKNITSNPCHVLYHLLPAITSHHYNLRDRPHNFALPLKDNCNFLSRMLYTNIY